MSLEVICEFDHEPVRMTVKGKGKLNYSWSLACPTCNTKLDILGNGLYCGRCGDRMKRLEKVTICPTCKYEVKVPEYVRPTMVSLVNTKAPPTKPHTAPPQPTTAAAKPAAPPATPAAKPAATPSPQPTPAAGVDQSILDSILKLIETRGQVEMTVVRNLIKARLKQEVDPGPYVQAVAATGKAKPEGDKLVKSS